MLNNLPTWDLGDLYPNALALEQDLARLKEKTERFKATYSTKPEKLYATIQEFEHIEEISGRLFSYVSLEHYADLHDPEIAKRFQHIQETVTRLASELLFFALDLCRWSDTEMQEIYHTYHEVKRYQPWIDHVRLFKPHQFEHQEMEAYACEKSLTSCSAWVRLHDETLAAITFDWQGEQCGISKVLDGMSSLKAEDRKSAAISLSTGLRTQTKTLTYILNTLLSDKTIEDRHRHYQDPVASRHLQNQIEPEVVDMMTKTIKESYKDLSHRYYTVKAQILGQAQLEYWDRNAPIFVDKEIEIPYAEAQTLVKDAYQAFSPTLGDLVQKFFDNAWIDVPTRTTKDSGAFSHPTVPSAHPYILLNYQGKIRDVATLAHELGHGVHQLLAAPQGLFLSDTPLTIAETASVFGEMLTFDYMLQVGLANRKTLLAGKIEDMLSTVVRQVAFYDFECKLHNARKKGELSIEQIEDMWMQVQTESLGPSVHLDDAIKPFWSYISHFIHAPFYVYAYAFGDCLVNALYAHYKASPDKAKFEQHYLDLLKAGGSKNYKELLKPFDLDPTQKTFWKAGLLSITDLINQLEALL